MEHFKEATSDRLVGGVSENFPIPEGEDLGRLVANAGLLFYEARGRAGIQYREKVDLETCFFRAELRNNFVCVSADRTSFTVRENNRKILFE